MKYADTTVFSLLIRIKYFCLNVCIHTHVYVGILHLSKNWGA